MEKKPDAVKEVQQTLSVLRVIVLALAAGVSVFVGYVLTTEVPDAQDKTFLWMYMAIFAGMALLGRLVVPGFIFGTIRRKIAHGTWQPDAKHGQSFPKTDEGLLMAALQMKTIIGCAILEAAAFANAFSYMEERNIFSLAVTMALVLMIVAHFPLRLWLDGWLERQLQWLEEERSLRPLEGRAS